MISLSDVKESINVFINWVSTNGYFSYDPYDLWSTKYGLLAKKIYYRKKIFSIPFIIPIVLADTYFPQIRKLFTKKKRYAISDAHIILSYLNLYEFTKKEEYLLEAISVSKNLLETSINGFSGYCWGYPFNWQNSSGLWKSDTPFITVTPYCFEAFLKLYDITNEQKYLDITYSISKFAYNDINFTEIRDDVISSSYSPFDNTKVINASAYNGFLFAEAYLRFHNDNYFRQSEKLLNFVIQYQNNDGSWIYAIDDSKNNFIDNIHTCFVLKNLIKANNILKRNDIKDSIAKGFGYYMNNLFDSRIRPKSFAKKQRINLIKTDLYDYAEGISLGLMMIEKNTKAKVFVDTLIKDIYENFITTEGCFTSKVNNLGCKLNIPYIRWGQSQMFYAITNYFKIYGTNIS